VRAGKGSLRRLQCTGGDSGSSVAWSRGKGGRWMVSRGEVAHTLRAGELGHGSWACRGGR
jgi:hypothetical protein